MKKKYKKGKVKEEILFVINIFIILAMIFLFPVIMSEAADTGKTDIAWYSIEEIATMNIVSAP